MDLPRIKQAIFILNNNLEYNFDVNSNINIKGLKRMLMTAAEIPKAGLRVFHENVEYTYKEDMTLNEIAPNLNCVKFKLTTDDTLADASIGIRFGPFCEKHESKYPYFYCFDCSKSICFECIKTDEHIKHENFEKYDYLQHSSILLEKHYSKLNKMILNSKEEKKNEFNELKIRVKKFLTIEIKKIIDHLNKLFQKIDENIDLCYNIFENSTNNMENNIRILYNHCCEGLEKLKSDIILEDMMIDEKIFLYFDKKFKEIIQFQQTRIDKDVINYINLNELLKSYFLDVENFNNGIIGYFDNYLNNNSVTQVPSNIVNSRVLSIDKSEIEERLFVDRKNYNFVRTYTSEKKRNFSPAHIKNNVENNLTRMNSSSKNLFSENVLFMSCIPGTRKILTYKENGLVDIKHIESNNSISKDFLMNCCWLNYDNKLFITGGEINNIASNISVFYDYDSNKKNETRISDMISPRYCHSMISYQDFIYAIGGANNPTCEKYDIKNSKWIKINNLLNDQELKNPILHIYHNFLYCFFGMRENYYIDTIQRINLKTPKDTWQFVSYTNPSSLDLKLIGSGIIEINENKILMIGGKNNEKIINNSFNYCFKNNTFSFGFVLPDIVYFHESHLRKIDKNRYAQFSYGSKDVFILNTS